MAKRNRNARLVEVVTGLVQRFTSLLSAEAERKEAMRLLQSALQSDPAYSTRKELVRGVTEFRRKRLQRFFGANVFVSEPAGDEEPIAACVRLMRVDEAEIAAGALERYRRRGKLPDGFYLQEQEGAQLRAYFASGGQVRVRVVE